MRPSTGHTEPASSVFNNSTAAAHEKVLNWDINTRERSPMSSERLVRRERSLDHMRRENPRSSRSRHSRSPSASSRRYQESTYRYRDFTRSRSPRPRRSSPGYKYHHHHRSPTPQGHHHDHHHRESRKRTLSPLTKRYDSHHRSPRRHKHRDSPRHQRPGDKRCRQSSKPRSRSRPVHRSRSHCRVKHEARSPVKSKIKSRLGPRPSDNFPLVEVFNMDNAVGEIFDSILLTTNSLITHCRSVWCSCHSEGVHRPSIRTVGAEDD